MTGRLATSRAELRGEHWDFSLQKSPNFSVSSSFFLGFFRCRKDFGVRWYECHFGLCWDTPEALGNSTLVCHDVYRDWTLGQSNRSMVVGETLLTTCSLGIKPATLRLVFDLLSVHRSSHLGVDAVTSSQAAT